MSSIISEVKQIPPRNLGGVIVGRIRRRALVNGLKESLEDNNPQKKVDLSNRLYLLNKSNSNNDKINQIVVDLLANCFQDLPTLVVGHEAMATQIYHILSDKPMQKNDAANQLAAKLSLSMANVFELTLQNSSLLNNESYQSNLIGSIIGWYAKAMQSYAIILQSENPAAAKQNIEEIRKRISQISS